MDPFPVGDEHSHPANLLADIRGCSQVGTRVFFLEGGRTRTGTVQNTETIEVCGIRNVESSVRWLTRPQGLRYVVIKLDDGSPHPVKLPCVFFCCAPIGEAHYV